MAGKCRDSERFIDVPAQFRFKARVFDFDPWAEDGDAEEKVVDVEMIDYKTGHIWHSGGFRSTNYELLPITA